MMERLQGSWRLKESDSDFEKYLIACGIGKIWREIALKSRPTIVISEDSDGTWTVEAKSQLKVQSISFRLGEVFNELRGDGKAIKSMAMEEGGKLILKQKGAGVSGEDAIITREVDPTGQKMVVTLKLAGVESHREYERLGEVGCF